MISDQARQRAEKSFKKEDRTQDARKSMTEYERQALATREKNARLKELRLAREAETRSVIALRTPPLCIRAPLQTKARAHEAFFSTT
jgi:hypothetical protein